MAITAPPRWLTLDPGETTGWAFWHGADLVDCGQDPLDDFVRELDDALQDLVTGDDLHHDRGWAGLDLIVAEDWVLYPWRAQELSWSRIPTLRGIGAIEYIARKAAVPVKLQPAKIKEAAEAAGATELFVTPLHENRHANDAIRHGVFYLATAGALSERVGN